MFHFGVNIVFGQVLLSNPAAVVTQTEGYPGEIRKVLYRESVMVGIPHAET
jgi:hypothetical protein